MRKFHLSTTVMQLPKQCATHHFLHLGDCTECPGRESLREMLERYFNEEEIEEIEFKQWTTTDRSTLQTIVQSTDEFIESFLDKLEKLRRHDFIAKQQSRYLAERKESLKEGEFLVIGDFSENFSFVVQDKAQSFHWDNGMVTLHPFVYYYKDEGQICHGNFVLISDCNTRYCCSPPFSSVVSSITL